MNHRFRSACPSQRCRLDLDAGTPTIEVIRVVVDRRVIESDGKAENGT
jgi:hypothetical protein